MNRLALTTGTNPVPAGKQAKGYRFEPDKFRIAGLTPKAGDLVSAPRALECPVQLEATLSAVHEMAGDNPEVRGRLLSIELRIVRVHLDPAILLDDSRNKIDPDKWRPLIMSFQHFYPLGSRLQPSRLATIPEEQYRTPEIPDVHTTTGSFIHPENLRNA